MRASDETRAVAAALCEGCGLCCDGTLYGRVPLDAAAAPGVEGEAARLARRGLPVVRADGAPALDQPCGALRGTLCAVYDERPSACARYACELRKAVEGGARSAADARAAVAHVRTLVGLVRADFGLAPAASVWQGIAAVEPPAAPDARRAWEAAHARGIGALVALRASVCDAFEPRFPCGAGRR